MTSGKPIKSVVRALDIIETVAAEPSEVKLADLARKMNLKPPTLHQFLRTLVSKGWLEANGKPSRYRLGQEPLRLLHRESRRMFKRHAGEILLRLEELYPAATFTLGEVSGGEVYIQLRVSPVNPGNVEENTRRTLHPYGSATPILFQAMWTEEERELYNWNHPFWENGGAEIWKSIENFENYLEKVRHQGYVWLELEGEKIIKIAVPVVSASGHIQAALGTSAPVRELSGESKRNELLCAMRQSAGELSEL